MLPGMTVAPAVAVTLPLTVPAPLNVWLAPSVSGTVEASKTEPAPRLIAVAPVMALALLTIRLALAPSVMLALLAMAPAVPIARRALLPSTVFP